MLLAIGSLALIGAALGTLLGVASRRLRVEPLPLDRELLALLPGCECGQCGFVGCAQAAVALANGKALPNLCRPGGLRVARVLTERLAERLGAGAQTAAAVTAGGDRSGFLPAGATGDDWLYDGQDTETPLLAAACPGCSGRQVTRAAAGGRYPSRSQSRSRCQARRPRARRS
ncbi:MAG: (Fe-S)-binding protein [Rhodospirillaceae bacterium]